jgi:hypothetical protein
MNTPTVISTVVLIAAVFSPAGDEVFWCTNVGWYSEHGKQGMLRLYFTKTTTGGPRRKSPPL